MNNEYAIVSVSVVVVIGSLVLAYLGDKTTANKIPNHVASFCQAQFEVYDIPYDDCITSYRQHKK